MQFCRNGYLAAAVHQSQEFSDHVSLCTVLTLVQSSSICIILRSTLFIFEVTCATFSTAGKYWYCVVCLQKSLGEEISVLSNGEYDVDATCHFLIFN